MYVTILPFNSFALILIILSPLTRPCLLSQQPPSRTASDQQIKPSPKLHLQQQQSHAQRTTTAAPRPTSSQRTATATAATTRSNKKSGFTLTSPVVAAHEVEGEGDSDEWVSSESAPVTPQNQSSDSESGDDEDDDVVRNLPAHLNLAGAAHIATSPDDDDDQEPPTPTVPQVKMQPPTPVNNVKEQTRCRLSTSVLNEVEHDRKRTIISSADDHADTVDQESVRDCDHHARPEEGLASTPRPRVMVDRDTELSRHPPLGSLSDPPLSDSSARKPPVVNPRLSGNVKDRPQRQTLSAHSVSQSHLHIASDSSPGPRADNNPQGRDQISMTQVSEDPPVRTITNTKTPYV